MFCAPAGSPAGWGQVSFTGGINDPPRATVDHVNAHQSSGKASRPGRAPVCERTSSSAGVGPRCTWPGQETLAELCFAPQPAVHDALGRVRRPWLNSALLLSRRSTMHLAGSGARTWLCHGTSGSNRRSRCPLEWGGGGGGGGAPPPARGGGGARGRPPAPPPPPGAPAAGPPPPHPPPPTPTHATAGVGHSNGRRRHGLLRRPWPNSALLPGRRNRRSAGRQSAIRNPKSEIPRHPFAPTASTASASRSHSASSSGSEAFRASYSWLAAWMRAMSP